MARRDYADFARLESITRWRLPAPKVGIIRRFA